MADINATCPHCERSVTYVSDNQHKDDHIWSKEGADGSRGLHSVFLLCPNPECRKITINATLYRSEYKSGDTRYVQPPLREWRLVPEGTGRTWPDYIPAAIREDYAEACGIAELSPKASATLARRTMQGILRDFYKAKGKTLAKELAHAKDKIDPDVWEAIDALRRVGNIGAHMEKDIDIIVSVDPGEAQKLIKLVELMLDETYVAQHKRKESTAAVVAMAQDKKAQRSGKGISAAPAAAQPAPAEIVPPEPAETAAATLARVLKA